MHTRNILSGAAALGMGALAPLLPVTPLPADAALSGASSMLTRAPYLTDLTQSSVAVNWATSSQTRGVVEYGPPGDCTAQSVTSPSLGSPHTVGSVKEYLDSVSLTGLSPASAYCYRVTDAGSSPVDLLGDNASPGFTTLESPGSSAPLTFDVLGDWGDTTNSGVNDGSLNANQAGIDAGIARSGAQFAVSVGDVAYPGGTQTEYGDLNQTGANVSAVFGPSYWAVPGERVPLYVASGNHGENVNEIDNMPEQDAAALSGGVFSMVSYPSVDGSRPVSYPTTYYAFSTGDVRFYVLDASWGNSNVGAATGGQCGSNCAIYQVDHDAKWTVSSAEYQWLARDLAAHPGGIKLAFLHFPLHSDNASQSSDLYLADRPGSSGSLEQLLAKGGVQIAFSGHAHIYERNLAPPGGVISYVTGGGGAQAEPVGPCSGLDAYAVGWSYSHDHGSACGSAAAPTSDAQVYNFLKVTVDGTAVTVTPTDAAGQSFDVQTYQFAPSAGPAAPAGLAVTRQTSTAVTLGWAGSPGGEALAGYDIYRDGLYLATVGPTATGYTDATVSAGTSYRYEVVARDLTGGTAAAAVASVGSPDTVPPPAPTGLSVSPTGYTAASLSWTGVSDPAGVYGYDVIRNGASIAELPAGVTSYTDTELLPGSTYSYQVEAIDWAGNYSAATGPLDLSTPPDTSPPSAPGTPVVTPFGPSALEIAWTAATDNVGVVRYDVVRDGAVVATVAGTAYVDTSASPSASYSYQVVAYDAAGNSTPSATVASAAPPAAPGVVFQDGFETGDFSRWTSVSGGLSVESSIVHSGAFAAEETSSGTPSYAYETLSGGYSELWAAVWVDYRSASSSVNLFGFRAGSGGSIVNLYVNANGKLALRNNVGKVTTTSSTYMPAGGWHELVLHAVVSGTSGSLGVTLDGSPVAGLSLSGQNLGTDPIGKFQLGETDTARTYDVCFDDVTVSSVAP